MLFLQNSKDPTSTANTISLKHIPISLVHISFSISSLFPAIFLSPLLSPRGSYYESNPWLSGLGTTLSRHLEYL